MRNLTHRHRRDKRCGEHRCYLTLEDACSNLFLLAHSPERKAGPTETNLLNVYRCHQCGEFHVGHIPAAIRLRFQLN